MMSGQRRGGRDRAPLPDFAATSSQWLPVVQLLRPHTSWTDAGSLLTSYGWNTVLWVSFAPLRLVVAALALATVRRAPPIEEGP